MPGDISINDGSVGFLNKSGNLKSSEENKAALKKIDQAAEGTQVNLSKPPTDQAAFSSETISSALGSVRARTESDANKIADVINIDADNLRKAKDISEREIKVLKELRSANQAGDTEKQEQLKAQFSNIQGERAQLVEKTKQDNNALVTERVRSIRVGNETKTTIRTEAVKVENFEKADLNSVAGVNKALRQRDTELQNTNTQLSDLDTKRAEVSQVTQRVREELRTIEESLVKSFSDASESANKIAQEIKSGAQTTFESATLNKINQQVVLDLLR